MIGDVCMCFEGAATLSAWELAQHQRVYGGGGSMASVDGDGDGAVSDVELKVATWDVDGDGGLSGAEFDAFKADNGGSGSMAQVDVDGDGSISAAELAAWAGSFASADSDGNGMVTAAELGRFQQVYGGSGSLLQIDSDGDGGIEDTAAEWQAYIGSASAADSDGNLRVSAAELAQYQSVH